MKSIEELKAIREKALGQVNLRTDRSAGTRVVVGMATCGIAAGARPVLQALLDDVQANRLEDVTVSQTGCIGVCRLEPMVEVYEPGKEKVTYVKVTPDVAHKIVEQHLKGGAPYMEHTIGYYESHNK
ncbi:(2Fe-2S) ferredoxin domain-containing protein [Clostridia bacterium OttesenSCG-928-F22]|nr:(2Fe-2S) ferredoxin domain-containing protein [Clostridia bacterium OttesenSCG-928-F22]